MTELAVLLPLLLAAVVALSIIVFVRIASAALRQTRGASRYGVELAGLGSRLDRTLDEIVQLAAPVRDGHALPVDLAARASAAERDVRGIVDATRHLDARHAAPLAPLRERLLAAATHACAALNDVERTARAMQPEEGTGTEEEQRSVERALKRAYLDLVHVRVEVSDASAAATASVDGPGGPGPAT